jgi:hypothetical protein
MEDNTTLSEPSLHPSTAFVFFADSIYLVGLGTVLYAFFMLLRPEITSAHASFRERARAQAIVSEHGHSDQSTLLSLPTYSYFLRQVDQSLPMTATGVLRLPWESLLDQNPIVWPQSLDSKNFFACMIGLLFFFIPNVIG